MIFQRCTQKCEYDFRIGNGVIYVMQNYTYLGTPITSHLAGIEAVYRKSNEEQ